jgi:hypothetical protein
MAPTAMKTVPSGILETRINGASAVGGTDGATITNAPARVGRPLGRPPPSVALPPPVITGTDTDEAADPEPVILPVGEGPVDVAEVFDAGWVVLDPSSPDALVGSALPVCFAAAEDLEADCDDAALGREGRDLSVWAEAEYTKRVMAAVESNCNRENFIPCVGL